jgi:acyl-CoA thioester hydrolase
VVRAHRIEYVRPAFAGDAIEVLTWVAHFRGIRSLRKYKFVRPVDHALLARAETQWVFTHLASGRPCRVPPALAEAFEVVAPEHEP